RVLYKTLLPRLLVQMETALQEYRGNPEYLYETLRVYLMFSDPKRLQKDLAHAWVLQDWEKNLPYEIERDTLLAMNGHLEALLESFPQQPPVELDGELVSSVRSILQSLPVATRIYFRFKGDAMADSELRPFRFIDEVGEDAAFIFQFNSGKSVTHGINGFFTKEGYRKYFIDPDNAIRDKYLDEQWVMGEEFGAETREMNFARIEEQVENLYLDDYLQTWRLYMDDLDIVPMNSTSQTLSILSELAEQNSPLIKLLKGIKRHTTKKTFSVFEELQESENAEEKVAGEDSALDKIKQKLYSSKEMPEELMVKDGENQVTRYFEALNALTTTHDGKNLPIQDTIRMIDELFIYLGALDKSQNKGRVAWNESKNPLGGSDVMREMTVEISRLPEPLSRIMNRISNRATAQTVSDARNYMQRQWISDVSTRCTDMIANRYPFNKKSKREATMDDLAAYFGPNGIVERYFDDYLIDYVDTSRRPWQWTRANGVNTGFSSRALQQVEIAKVIRDTFFRAGSSTPSISFEIKPIEMDKNILRMGLLINDQQMNYSHGPRGGKRFRWPNLDNNRGIARLVFTTTEGQESITEHGDWALFRLFDRAKIKKLDRNRFMLTFVLKGRHRVSLELRAGSVYNPFMLSELSQVRCN
ncbi:MAG: type VI secretion system membrane subunit TssM, partial [Chromatiales bacterium]|nr:type VI secretion system membrane subunit TssM [Chromatiales bacterium]